MMLQEMGQGLDKRQLKETLIPALLREDPMIPSHRQVKQGLGRQ